MARAFVIRPFNKKNDSAGTEIDFDRIHLELIKPALEAAGFSGDDTGEIIESGNIREDMFALILGAELVVCDITCHNANVFYELGIRHALRKKSTVLIKGKPVADGTPFDLLTDRYFAYEIGNPAASQSALVEVLTASRVSSRETDSPIFKMLPGLAESDPDLAGIVPLDFREEIDRAVAGKSRGWLRLLADDLRGLTFERAGLRLVGDAQWKKLKDLRGARDSFERVRSIKPADTAANLALANIYERLHGESGDLVLLVQSDHAIDQVLANKPSPDQRSEALALRGRNLKSRWRLGLARHPEVAARRAEAVGDIRLRQSFHAYREAFRGNLNHYWSGLAALQMGKILLDLTADRDSSWRDAFATNGAAEVYRAKLSEDVATLTILVSASLEASRFQKDDGDADLIWIGASEVDLQILEAEAPSPARAINRYRNAIPDDSRFVCDAVRRQLDLYALLGYRAELALRVIAALDERFPPLEVKRKLSSTVGSEAWNSRDLKSRPH